MLGIQVAGYSEASHSLRQRYVAQLVADSWAGAQGSDLVREPGERQAARGAILGCNGIQTHGIDLVPLEDLVTRRLLALSSFVLVSCSVISCDYAEQQKARKGLDRLVDQLPLSSDFEIAARMLDGSSSLETCHYAEILILLGSALSEAEAMDLYVDELQSMGWDVEEHNSNERVLIRGTQERIRITNYPRWYVETDREYVRVKDACPTIIFVNPWF